MLLEKKYLKDLILKYYYSSKEITKVGEDELYTRIIIRKSEGCNFTYYLNVNEIFNDYLFKPDERNEEFKELIKYLNEELECKLFIFKQI